MPILFKILGASGMLFITTGILQRSPLHRNWLFIIGGLMLLTYSIYLADPVFIPLESIFTIASMYEIVRIKSLKHQNTRT